MDESNPQDPSGSRWDGIANAAGVAKRGAISTGNMIGNVTGIRKEAGPYLLIALLLYLSDWFLTRFNGASLTFFWQIFNNFNYEAVTRIIFNLGGVAVLVWYYFSKKPTINELVSFWVVQSFFFLIIASTKYSVGMVLHLSFAIYIWISYMRDKYNNDKSRANYTFVVLLFIDFFAFSIAESYLTGSWATFFSNRFLIPVWFFYIYFTSFPDERPKWATIINVFLWIALIANLVILNPMMFGNTANYLDEGQKETALGVWTNTWDNIAEFFTGTYNVIVGKTNQSIGYASGDYYTGEIDNRVDEKLGVYFESYDTKTETFYEDENIDIWATLIAKTLDDPIEIKLGCYSEYSSKKTVGVVSPDYYESDPNVNLMIDSYGEESVDCRFDKGALARTNSQVMFSALFEFSTSAYLRTYYIKEDVATEYRRNDQDILDVYQVSEKNPTAIYTNGPVYLGMETKKTLPISLSSDTENTHMLGITIDNNGWDGNINEFYDLIIYVPDKMEIVEDSCNFPFEEYETEEGEYKENYNAYHLVNDASRYSYFSKIELPFSFRCRVSIPETRTNALFGNSDFVEKNFIAVAKYKYDLQKAININVKTPLGFYVKFEPANIVKGNEIQCVGKLGSAQQTYKIKSATYEITVNGLKVSEGLASCDEESCKTDVDLTYASKGKEITCTMTAVFSDGMTDKNEATATVLNSEPVISEIKIEPTSLKVGELATCKVTVEDKDNEQINVFFQTYGKDMQTETVNCGVGSCETEVIINTDSKEAGESIVCAAIPMDEEDTGERKEVSTTLVKNE